MSWIDKIQEEILLERTISNQDDIIDTFEEWYASRETILSKNVSIEFYRPIYESLKSLALK
jgi:hypothetical protein